MYIYKITNIKNNKIYIGQTTQKNKNRLCRHLSGSGSSLIASSLKYKYTKEDFVFETIEVCSDIIELNDQEMYWIGYYNCLHPNGYNLKLGGNNKGQQHPDTKLKLRNYMLKNMDTIELTKRLEKTWVSNCRKIKSYNIKTKEIKYYRSIASVKEKGLNKGCVGRVLKGKRKTYNNCLWQYEELEFDLTKVNKKRTWKSVLRTSKDGDTREYKSLIDAQKEGFIADSISRSIKKNRLYKDYKWKFL